MFILYIVMRDLNCIRTENEIEETTKDSKIHPKEEGLYSVGDTDC